MSAEFLLGCLACEVSTLLAVCSSRVLLLLIGSVFVLESGALLLSVLEELEG